MTREKLASFYLLESQIEKEAIASLKWYDKEIQKVYKVEDLYFDCLEEESIFYEGYVYQENINFILPVEIITLSDEEKIEYKEKYLIEQKKLKEERKKEIELLKKTQKEKAEKEQYEYYLELKEKYKGR